MADVACSSRLVSAVLIAAGALFVAVPSASAADDLGDVQIVDERGEPLLNGGSATQFSLSLPADAACPGDSMNDQWRVQSFVVPQGVEIDTLSYGVIGPEGENQWALFGIDTKPIAQRLTVANTIAGQPGRIGGLGLLSFAVLSPGMLPAGEYRLGIACTLFGDTAQYWDADIVIEDAADDQPAGFVWRLPEAPTYVPPEAPFPWMRATGLVLLVLGPLLALVLIRRSRGSSNPSKETS